MKSAARKLSLEYLVREPSEKSEHPPMLLLLHGYGSNEQDLASLTDEFPPELLVLSVRAPRTLTEGSYAWFAIDFSSGTPVNNKVEAEESRLVLKKFIDEAIAHFSADKDRVTLLGFSQGAIMSYSIALTFPGFVSGIIALSGRILKEIRPAVASSGHEKLRVFIGHGTEDTVLRIGFAREAKEYLATLNISPEYHEYPIAHSISKQEQDDVLEWFKKS